MAYRNDRALGDEYVNRAEIEELRRQVSEVYGDRASFSANVRDDGTLDIRLVIQDERTRNFDQGPQKNLLESQGRNSTTGDLENARTLNERAENTGQDNTIDFKRDQNEYDTLAREVADQRTQAYATRDAGVGADVSDERLIDLDEKAILRDAPAQDRNSNLEFDAAEPQLDERSNAQNDIGLQLDNDSPAVERNLNDQALLDRGPAPYGGTDLQAELARVNAQIEAASRNGQGVGVGADLSDERLIDLDENAIRLDSPAQDRTSNLDFDAADSQLDARFNAQNDNGLQAEQRDAFDRALLDRGPPLYHGTDLQVELDRVNAQIEAASRTGQVAGVGPEKADTALEKNAGDNLGSLYTKLHDLENEPSLDAQTNGNLELTKGGAQPSQGFSLQNALDEINRGITELKERLGIDHSLDERSRQSAFGRG